MIAWKSRESLAAQTEAFHKVDLILFGIMLWEVATTLWFDVAVLRRRVRFGWPVLIYWAAKYATLWFTVSIDITHFQVVQAPLNCQALGEFTDLMARVGMACASALLMLRAMALWRNDIRVVIPLLILHLGQWALYLHNVFIVKEHWDNGCVIVGVYWPSLKVQFIYTMCFDLVVLVLACCILLDAPGLSNLWKVLFMDGLYYFLIAFGSYLACTILAFLNISLILSFIFSDCATVLMTIFACRSFVRIRTRPQEKNQPDVELTTSGSGFRVPRRSPLRSRSQTVRSAVGWRDDGVRVYVEALPRYPDPVAQATSSKAASDSDLDLEAQRIRLKP